MPKQNEFYDEEYALQFLAELLRLGYVEVDEPQAFNEFNSWVGEDENGRLVFGFDIGDGSRFCLN